MNTEQAQYLLALKYCKGIGHIMGKRLIEIMGSAKKLWTEASELQKTPGLRLNVIQDVGKRDLLHKAAKEIDRARAKGWKVLCYPDTDYPPLLKHCADAPLVLFQKGVIDLSQDRRQISMVGTRQLTHYGRECIAELVSGLATYQPIMVSGLAYGADIAAHQAALDNQLSTIGVLAHGLDRMYPHEHKALAERICGTGGLLTEYTPSEPILRENFPLRNRIIAGLSLATIIIETAQKGGAMITAKYANIYNREVFAIPGPLKAPYSTGCNHLIKTHQAHLISSAQDVAYLLNWSNPSRETHKAKQTKLFNSFESEEEQIIYTHLSEKGKQQLDEISYALHIPISRLMSILLSMEIKGWVKALSGKYFEAIKI